MAVRMVNNQRPSGVPEPVECDILAHLQVSKEKGFISS